MKIQRLVVMFIAGLLAWPTGVWAQTVVRIGIVGPLTGSWAAGDYSQLNGAKLKVDQLNAAQRDYRLELLSEDDASNCDQSINATIKLITQQKIVGLIGAFNSPCTLTLVPVTARCQVPEYTVSIGNAITKQGSRFIFRMAPSAETQTKQLATFAVRQMGQQKVGIIFTNDEYGRSGAESFKATLASLGLEPAIYETYTRGDKDFTGQLVKLRSSQATAVYVTGALQEAALIARQIQQMGLKMQILGDTGSAGNPDYVKLAGNAADGTVLVEPWTPLAEESITRKFVSEFRQAFQRDPDSWSAEMYDAVGIIFEGVKSARTVSAKAGAEYTRQLTAAKPYRGLMGDVYFDENGDPLYSLYKIKIVDGMKRILGR